MVLLTEWPGPASENAPVSPGGTGGRDPLPRSPQSIRLAPGEGGRGNGVPPPPGPHDRPSDGEGPPSPPGLLRPVAVVGTPLP